MLWLILDENEIKIYDILVSTYYNHQNKIVSIYHC